MSWASGRLAPTAPGHADPPCVVTNSRVSALVLSAPACGGGGSRGVCRARRKGHVPQDLFDHRRNIFVDVEIVKAQHMPPASAQIHRSSFVVRHFLRSRMRCAIDLDHQLGGKMSKVSDVRTDRMLTAKPGADRP